MKKKNFEDDSNKETEKVYEGKIKIYRYNFVIFPYTEFDNWNYHNLWNTEHLVPIQ